MNELKPFVNVKETLKTITENNIKIEAICIYPDFDADGQDIMKKGGKFYAVLNRATGMWSQDESDPLRIIDSKIDNYILKKYPEAIGTGRTSMGVRVIPSYAHTWDSGIQKKYNQWLMNQSLNFNYIQLDQELTFKSTVVTPTMYRSKRLSYDIQEGNAESYERLISTLYDKPDRDKLEWAMGSILAGESKYIDKLIVIYSSPGFGKSTVLNIIKDLFNGYWATFVVADLVDKSKQFGTAAFKDNPLVAIDIDGKMENIETPVINGLVSHEDTMINEKNKAQYTIRPNTMLFIATNHPVDFKDAKVGIARRLLDVYPSKRLLEVNEYDLVVSRIRYELPAIAYHCLSVYRELGRHRYNGYTPTEMIRRTNRVWNFLQENQSELEKQDYISRRTLYNQFKAWCKDSGWSYDMTVTKFTEQVLEYYDGFEDWHWIDGKSVHNVFHHFNLEKLEGAVKKKEPVLIQRQSWIDLQEQSSILDELYSDRPAQYDVNDKPETSWAYCKTKLKDIDTHKLHWLSLPKQTIRIDFDKKGPDGKKNLELNVQAVMDSGLPPTYCEVSKSGGGLHLYYIYDGDVNELSHLLTTNVEIKTAADKENPINPDRRLLTKCNNLPVAHLSAGLPLKEKKVVSKEIVTTEKGLRTTITKDLNKEIHGDTRSSIDHIYYILEEAYNSGVVYDVSDMFNDIYTFAKKATNQSEICCEKVAKMHFKSETDYIPVNANDTKMTEAPRIFFDIEVAPNVLLICWMYDDDDAPVNSIFNPTPDQIANLYGIGSITKPEIGGFNNRGYDDHILYGRMMGDSILEGAERSDRIINGDNDVSNAAKFFQAYRLSSFDVFDFAKDKMSLKKREIELGLPHLEFDIPWGQPIPESEWPRLAEYCSNDVRATRAVFHHCYGDYIVRKVLASITGLEVIDTNRQHITKLLLGDDKSADHVYTDLATGIAEDVNGIPYPLDPNIINAFPGYEYKQNEQGKWINWYRGTDVGRGGYVYAEPGMYSNVALLDVGNMHGASIIALNKFGKHTENFRKIREGRMAIKHHDYDKVYELFDGKLDEYLVDDEMANNLQEAFKLVLNSTYGIAAAGFDNPLKDPRDVNNIIALRGALFMRTLQDEVSKRGFTVAHIKTDSIKIPNATPEIIEYVINFGRLYGYEFEHEATYERMCLVNDAVYIAKYDDQGIRNKGGKHAGEWTATGTQFQVPYVFKTLFSKEPIIFSDLCETKSCSTAFYLDMKEDIADPDGHNYIFVGKVGQFCPMLPGHGAGTLVRISKDGSKYDSANGAKGYLWMESELVKAKHLEEFVDDSYYRHLVDEAVNTITQYGDFDQFVNGNLGEDYYDFVL